MVTALQYGEALVAGKAPAPAIARLLGFRIESVGQDSATVVFDAGPEHANPMGTLHGGVLSDIADAAMGMAYANGLADGETFTTLELKINFLRPVWTAHLRATASVKQRGRTVGLVECDIRDERGRLIAHASSTCMTLRGDKAIGRSLA